MMSQSNNPAVQRALRAVQSQSFPPEETTWQRAIRLVKPFVPIGHAADDYAHIHADLGRPEDIVAVLTKVHKLGDVSSGPSSTFVIDILIKSVEEYFTNHARDDVTRCWPNLRGMIQMTSATTDDEDNVFQGCFNFRRSAKGLLKLATRLVVYLWRSSYYADGWSDIMQLVDEVHAGDIDAAVAVVVDSGIIAQVLRTALLEPPSSAQDATVMPVWATAQMFYFHKGKNEYQLCSAGVISKSMAAIHNLVRVAACTYIAKMDSSDNFKADAEKAAGEVRSAVCSSWLAGAIRAWRDIEARTTTKLPKV